MQSGGAPAPAGARPAPAPKRPLSQGAGGTGFTNGQLAVLKSQILAFRSLKARRTRSLKACRTRSQTAPLLCWRHAAFPVPQDLHVLAAQRANRPVGTVGTSPCAAAQKNVPLAPETLAGTKVPPLAPAGSPPGLPAGSPAGAPARASPGAPARPGQPAAPPAPPWWHSQYAGAQPQRPAASAQGLPAAARPAGAAAAPQRAPGAAGPAKVGPGAQQLVSSRCSWPWASHCVPAASGLPLSIRQARAVAQPLRLACSLLAPRPSVWPPGVCDAMQACAHCACVEWGLFSWNAAPP